MTQSTKSDSAPWHLDLPDSPSHYKGVKRTSQYIAMRDGIKIAIDIYLPRPGEPDEKFPTILHQTRYYRRFNYRLMLRLYMVQRDEMQKTIKRLVKVGYAFVTVDVRGTGASFGSRQMEFSPDEIKDGAEIVNWIIEQNWSDGSVGTIGTSYTGSAAEMLLTNKHPAVKAAILRYANFDAYPDVVCPGGVRNENFMRTWSELNKALDQDKLPTFVRKIVGIKGWLAMGGVPRVDADRNRSLVREATGEHSNNYDIFEASKQVIYRDSISDNKTTLDQLSPYAYMDQIEASGAAIYSWSSWFDGAFALSAIKRYQKLTSPAKKLILGPWDHGGRQNPDPHSGDQNSYFDHDLEVQRFFDFHLKDLDNGLDTDKPIHYFTMGEETWKSAHTWPPPGFKPTPFHLSQDRKIISGTPPKTTGTDFYQVDFEASTGKATRWVSLVNVAQVNIEYNDRKQRDECLLVYDSHPLDQDIEVTGHPLITLYLRSSAPDPQIFVYLEELTKDGEVHYVTEGVFGIVHRKISDQQSPYHLPVPYHTFKQADSVPLLPGEVAKICFDLLPISYRFKAGSSIRVAIAGADKDNFALEPPEPPEFTVFWGQDFPSHIELPTKLIQPINAREED